MREIKFRAVHYGELLNRVFTPFDAHKMLTGQLRNDDESDYFDPCAEFEQYTGLLDKNGKEIYEGDVVKMGDGILTVFYQAPSFVMKEKKTHKHWHVFVLAESERQFCEVIGNIHDNPELLEKTK